MVILPQFNARFAMEIANPCALFATTSQLKQQFLHREGEGDRLFVTAQAEP